jgi:quinoprotein glucose dehydrogenase
MPSLINIKARRTREQIAQIVRAGAGRMPGFANLTLTEMEALMEYVVDGENKELEANAPAGAAPKYRFTGYHKFLDPDGYPAVVPPWGTLNAINVNTGEYAWKIPFGEYPELAAKGLKDTGSENYGGPIVTAGGLLFIGATNFDKKFRAFDKMTGKLLWETTLPASGNATPATYQAGKRQFVLIYATGGKARQSDGNAGGVYVAFALPEN